MDLKAQKTLDWQDPEQAAAAAAIRHLRLFSHYLMKSVEAFQWKSELGETCSCLDNNLWGIK